MCEAREDIYQAVGKARVLAHQPRHVLSAHARYDTA
jgi:hypothetical protein